MRQDVQLSTRLPHARCLATLKTLASASGLLGDRKRRTRASMALLAASGLWLRVAAVSGATAIGLGAYGAHAFKPQACAIQCAVNFTIPMVPINASPTSGLRSTACRHTHRSGAGARGGFRPAEDFCCLTLIAIPQEVTIKTQQPSKSTAPACTYRMPLCVLWHS